MNDYKETVLTPIIGVTLGEYNPIDGSVSDIEWHPVGKLTTKTFTLENEAGIPAVEYNRVGAVAVASGENWEYIRVGDLKKFTQTGKCAPRRLIREFIKCIEKEGE